MAFDPVWETKTIRVWKHMLDTETEIKKWFFWSVKEVKRDADSDNPNRLIVTLNRDKRIPRYEEVVALELLEDRKAELLGLIQQQRKWPFLVMAFIGVWFFLIGFAALLSPGEWQGSSGSRWVAFLIGVALLIIGIWRWIVIYKRTKELKAEYEAHPTLEEIIRERAKLHEEILAEMRK